MPIVWPVDSELALPVAVLLGILAGALTVLGARYGRRLQPGTRSTGAPRLSDDAVRLLSVLPGPALVVDREERVLRASAQAVVLGVVAGDRIAVPEIDTLISQVRRDGVIRELDLELRKPPLRRDVVPVRIRVAPLSSRTILVLLEDVSQAARIDAVRRDFVANVSHELKTPVGALSLLSEAVLAASDEPADVRRFAQRMQTESQRLSNLVNDLIDLSRLQGAERAAPAVPVRVADVVREALEATRTAALAREIDVVASAVPGVTVLGEDVQLVTALRNLVTNALAYSPTGTQVSVTAELVAGASGEPALVELAVTDQGIGIPPAEHARIFERFYRVDHGRSRATGGTGLGLAIVKHICLNHGGECTVRSAPGHGSTFTLRLPVAPQLVGATTAPPYQEAEPVAGIRAQ